FVPPRSGFLAELSHFTKTVSREGLANAGFLKMALLLADSPANIESREVPHGQRSHGQAEIVERAVDFLNGCSFFQQKYRLAHVRRSEEHTSELQSRGHLVCRLLLEKKKKQKKLMHKSTN